jgi:hypothetical protein
METLSGNGSKKSSWWWIVGGVGAFVLLFALSAIFNFFGPVAKVACIWTFIGACLYFFDRLFGAKIYRQGTKDPSVVKEEKGIMFYNRRSRVRVPVAILIAIVTSLFWGDPDFFWNMIATVIKAAGLILGFYLGPYVWSLWEKRTTATAILDDIDAGKIDPVADAKRMGREAMTRSRDAIVTGVREAKSGVSEMLKETPPIKEPTPPPPTETAEPDPYERIRRFTEGRSK